MWYKTLYWNRGTSRRSVWTLKFANFHRTKTFKILKIMKIFKILHFRSNWVNHPLKWDNYVLFWISYLLFASQLIWFLNDFFVTHDLGPVKPGPRAAKPIIPPYVENNYRIEVKITFMLIAYLVLLCEFFGEFSIFHFCRYLVDIYWHPLLIVFLSFFFFLGKK